MRQGRKHGVPLSKNLGQLEVVGVEKVFCRSPSCPYTLYPKSFAKISFILQELW